MAQQLAAKPHTGAAAPTTATQSTSRNKEDIRELDFNQLVQRYEELQGKYSKVKRYYFEKEAQVTQLQNMVATQRLSMSKTSLDDAQYQQRFERLSGTINNLAFNIRKDWKHVVPWLRAVCNQDAHTTGTKEMTAVGRACISRWLVEHIFDRVFHPALPPEISSFLKATEKALRRQGQSGTASTEEQRDDLTTKITTWRLTTMEGLSEHFNSQSALQHQDSLTTGLTEELTLFLKSHLNEPAPAGLQEGVGTIVQLAISIAANMPLESRDVCVQYFLPGEPINETYMKLETGMTPLTHAGLDERLERAMTQQQRRLGGGDEEGIRRDRSRRIIVLVILILYRIGGVDNSNHRPGRQENGFGSKKRQRKAAPVPLDPAKMSADERTEYMRMLGIQPLLPGEGNVRFAAFFAVDVRGKIRCGGGGVVVGTVGTVGTGASLFILTQQLPTARGVLAVDQHAKFQCGRVSRKRNCWAAAGEGADAAAGQGRDKVTFDFGQWCRWQDAEDDALMWPWAPSAPPPPSAERPQINQAPPVLRTPDDTPAADGTLNDSVTATATATAGKAGTFPPLPVISNSTGVEVLDNLVELPWTGYTNERLSMPLEVRGPLVLLASFITGLGLGGTAAGQMRADRYRAENAHRYPTTEAGWYLYQRSKNYHIFLGGFSGGVRSGALLSLWAAGFMATEEGIDQLRARLLHRPDGQRDFVSTVIAALALAGVHSRIHHMNTFATVKSSKMALKAGLAFGLAQDALALVRGGTDARPPPAQHRMQALARDPSWVFDARLLFASWMTPRSLAP
ncbi:hypothetical protein DV738_g1942, partial [Chaetothyriales sp. CBS 135597]